MSGDAKEPLLIVSCSTSDGNINLNRKNLSSILSPVENLPVAIVSVAGPPKNGKSLLFGYIVRYLLATEQDELDWMDWDNPEKEMNHVKWPREKSPESPGIWSYHRPFLLDLDDGENASKVAVLLLYTQSSDRNIWVTENNEISALVGFTIRISSSIIFNVHKHLDEECLAAVASYVKHALHCGSISRQGRRGKSVRGGPLQPLQNASFLIRDWNFPSEFPYGVKGGRNFVKLEKLNVNPGHGKESRRNRQLINGVFQNVSGGLLPFPGVNVISSSTEFRGSISEMEMDFAKSLAEFIKQTVGKDQIVIKLDSAGNQVTGNKLREMIDAYIEGVKNMDSANLDTDRFLRKFRIKGSISVGEQKESIKPAMKAYADVWRRYERTNKVFNERQLREIQTKARRKALENLQNEVTGGNGGEEDDDYEYGGEDSDEEESRPTVNEQVKKMLIERIVKRFKEIQAEQTNKQVALMEQYKNDILQQYKELMAMSFPPDGRKPSEKIFQRESKNIMASLSAEFGEKIGGTGDRDMMGEKEQTEMDSLMDRLREEERIAYGKIFGSVEDEDEREACAAGPSEMGFDQYGGSRRMPSQRKQQYGFEAGNLLTINKSGISFDNNSISFSSRASEMSNEDFENMSIASWEGKEKVFKPKGKSKEELKREEERLKQRAKQLVDRLAKLHATELDSQVENLDRDLERIHEEHLVEVMETFENEMSYGRERSEYKLYQDILNDDLKSAFNTAKSKRRRVCKAKEVDEQGCKMRAVENYSSRLKEFLQKNKSASWAELEEESEIIKSEEMKILKKQLGGNAAGLKSVELTVHDIYEEIRDTLKSKQMTTENNMESTLHEYKVEYIQKMAEMSISGKEGKPLISLHEKLVKELVEKCKTMSLAQNSPSSKSVAQLEKMLNEAFFNIKKKQELKREHESGAVKVALREARQFYCQEMEKRLASQEFMTADNLLTLHKNTCEAAKKKYPNANPREIKTALETAFQKYLDENSMNANDEPAIGIDLGTTYSCVSVYQKGKVIILPNSIGKYTTPSYVLIPPAGKDIVGEPAKLKAYENPEGTIFDAKRILGRKFDDPKLQDDMKLWPFTVVDGGRNIPMIEVNGKRLNPEVVSAKILTQLKLDAEKYLKRKVIKAVITVPAYFTDGQKQATMDAGKMAGLDVLSILTEPVAAAMAYKLQYNTGDSGEDDRHILVYDLGGGTFDVAILKASKGKLDVLTVDGDTHLGGEDFDKNLMNHCAQEFKRMHNVDLFDGKDSAVKKIRGDVRRRLKRLQAVCEMQKIALTTSPSTDVTVDNICNGLDLDITVTRSTFEKINAQLFDSTIKVVESALKAAKLDKSKITDIVLVGGSTRIPKVQQLLQNFFPGKQLDKKINPDEAVAHGAGLMAAIKQGSVGKTNKDYYKIQDVTPMSIGVEVYGGGFSAIIPKNTKTPVMLKERYKTAHNNQTSVQITIYEGEDKIATKNKHLGDFYLNGIPPKNAGEENIDVEMVINDQGILHVTAKCSSTGTQSTVTVTENKQRMGKAAIQKYLADMEL